MHARTQAAALLALLLAARPAACAADSEFDDPDFADFDDDEAEATTGGLAGDDFLRENRRNPKVTQLPSGLQYKVLASGSGLEGRPGTASMCTMHYEGKLLSGEVFDSSMARGEPMTFQANQVIAGWTEALTLMTPGDRWQLTIPSDLAYGERGGGSRIPPNSVLVFRYSGFRSPPEPEPPRAKAARSLLGRRSAGLGGACGGEVGRARGRGLPPPPTRQPHRRGAHSPGPFDRRPCEGRFYRQGHASAAPARHTHTALAYQPHVRMRSWAVPRW